jgi:tryptophan 7-halogenase
MARPLKRIVIVGGGTAGWLSACRIAAHFARLDGEPISVTLIEAPDIPTIGVGEGTWPTMRATMAEIGISEVEMLVECDGAFKQGSRFDGWVSGSPGDSYLHPFTPPAAGDFRSLVRAWSEAEPSQSFAAAVTPQAKACALSLAPRQRQMPDYAGALNYAYHLDAAKLAALLSRHATQRLGVTHVRDQVVAIDSGEAGAIAAVQTRDQGAIAGDLFIDATGHAALLIGGHCQVPWMDRGDSLFNDRALAVQVPVAADSAIASQTIGTAHAAGWLWDIGLATRRGVGCVYASRFISDEDAHAVLRDYLARTAPDLPADSLEPRKLAFPTGHRAEFWRGNCVAIGLAAGFVEPLEASAIVLIELSLNALLDNFPQGQDTMVIHAARFNELFRARWDRIVEFLKLHYVLSSRTEPYWLAHRDPATVPSRLADLLRLWGEQPPSAFDFPLVDEIFPAASFQYVYYGMGGTTQAQTVPAVDLHDMAALLERVGERARSLAASLPTNRAYQDALRKFAAAAPGRERAVST